jgi:hypothetical protein
MLDLILGKRIVSVNADIEKCVATLELIATDNDCGRAQSRAIQVRPIPRVEILEPPLTMMIGDTGMMRGKRLIHDGKIAMRIAPNHNFSLREGTLAFPFSFDVDE